MIHIETITLKEHKEYGEMKTEVQIEGNGEVIKEEIKTLLLHAKKRYKFATYRCMCFKGGAL